MRLETRIKGIPAVIEYSITGSYFAATRETPAEYPEVTMEILDRRGRPAPWLERKLDEVDWVNLQQECWEAS